MKHTALLCLIAAVMPAFGQSIHRCTLPDGKTVYQSTPCTAGTGMVVPGIASHPDPSTLAEMPKDEPRIGMSDLDFLHGRRFPDQTNTTIVQGMRHEQWVYRSGPDKGYYYFDNGKLSAIQQ